MSGYKLLKTPIYGKERTADAAARRAGSGIRGHDHQGEDQLPGRLQGQMGDSFQPSCRFHPDLHHRNTHFRGAYRGVPDVELRTGRPVGRQPQQPYRMAQDHPREDRVQGHEGCEGRVPDHRRRCDESGVALRHDPARREPDRRRARRVLRRPEGRAAGDDLLSAGSGPQFRRDQAGFSGLADHRRLRHRAARRLASGRRGDRADEGRRSGEGSRRGEVLRLVFLHQAAAERGDRTETRREGPPPPYPQQEGSPGGKPLLSCAFVSLQSGDGRQRPLRSIPGSGIAVRRATRGAVRAPRAVFCPLFAVLRARSIRRRTPRG